MRRILCLVLLSTIASATALASQPGVQAIRNWKQADLCTKEAQTAYPDFTPEANAKRDAKLQECLARQNLPPRTPSQ
jgi:hypothetical protein